MPNHSTAGPASVDNHPTMGQGQVALLADQVFDGARLSADRAVLLEEGIVKAIVKPAAIPSGYSHLNFADCFISPGLIDLQLYGGNGKLFSHSADIEAIEATDAACRAGGCTHFMITTGTSPIDVFVKGLTSCRKYLDAGKKGLLGFHLEGPYINPVKRGAHIERFIKTPTMAEVDYLLEAGAGTFRIMTLAPERCDPAIIKRLIAAGVLVSAGHSNATYKEATAGFALGIPVCTHFFNAMSPLQGRAPGMVGAVYAHDRVMTSIIADGVHVDFDSVRLTKQIMGDRLFFITDAVTAFPEGNYRHVLNGDHYTLPDGTLSGSAMTMLTTVRNAVNQIGLSLEEALRMCCTYPASFFPKDGIGSIVTGKPADLIVVSKKDYSLQAILS